MKWTKRRFEICSDMGEMKVVWRSGVHRVDLVWSWDASLTVCWYKNKKLHRLDGPARLMSTGVETLDTEALFALSDPGMIDQWFRDNDFYDNVMTWFVHGFMIYGVGGRLTYQFPPITADFIRFKIGRDNRDVLGWLNVARVLKLMDDGLRKLKKAVGLLADV